MSASRRHSDSPVAALRRRLNMTQEEFAHAIGVTVSTVNRWENGHIEPSRLARRAMQALAREAGGDAEQLLGNNFSESDSN
jgi:DNA-binding transcriptional regulator YiaG